MRAERRRSADLRELGHKKTVHKQRITRLASAGGFTAASIATKGAQAQQASPPTLRDSQAHAR
jgi:hypothetical protein